jgi:endoglucanase
MAALALATHALDAAPPAADLLAVATVQEEVGCRGAVVAARLAKPDVVIVLEGLLADDLPGLAPYGEQQGALGAGVQVRAYDPTAIMNPRLVDLTLQARGRAGHPVPCGVLHGRHRRAFLPGP